jgi:hypothetical protein
MDSVNSDSSGVAALYAMKKAMDIQGQGVLKVLESAQTPVVGSGASVTGIGQRLDIRA